MDSIRGPSPVPSDAHFSSSNYSLTGSLPGSGSAGQTSYSAAQHRQLPWSSSSTESSWSNASIGNALMPSSHYHQLYARFNELQRENASLITKNTMLESKVDTLMMAYNMLLTRIPEGTLALDKSTALCQDDYPNVRFWTRQSWNLASQAQVIEIDEEGEAFPELEEEEEGPKQPLPSGRGKRRAAQGINVAMKYVELADGTIIDGFRAAEIRRYARSLWVKMALDGKLPATWSDADAASLTYYSDSMAQRFLEMRLCASDWKANLVATDNYPSWRHNWLKKKSKEGKRPSDTHMEENGVSMKKLKGLYDNEKMPLSQILPDMPKPTGSSDVAPFPIIHIIPGTPLKPQPMPMALPSQFQEGDHTPRLQPGPPYGLNFMIGNPLATSQQHQPEEVNTPQDHVPVTDAFKPIVGHSHNTSMLPVPTIAINGPKRSKGTRMRPTKNSTTARNLCAQEWVKQHPHGTTDDFKSYYDNLNEEQRQVWEDKSKAFSQSQ